MSPPSFSPELRFALELAQSSGRLTLEHLHKVSVTTKADGSPVTEADLLVEAHMVSRIRAAYPDHGILGEEGGEHSSQGPCRWVLDPIDGTSYFVQGLPRFANLIALMEHEQPVLGVVHMPATGFTLFAQRGVGCWLQSDKGPLIQAHATPEPVVLKDAVVSLGGLDGSEWRPGAYGAKLRLASLLEAAGEVEIIADATHYMLLARGIIHATLDPIMQPWDIAPLVPCIREAGGVISALDGDANVVFSGGVVAAANAVLHRELLEQIAVPRQ